MNKKVLLVNLWNQQGDTLAERVKGKFRGKAFKANTKLFIKGNPLFLGIGTSDNITAKTNAGELAIYHNHGGIGFFTLLSVLCTNIGLDKIRLRAKE
ncbi:hypothetical protein [Sabulibacter ruber]|uniref:hypothetical protein n=1 Tax=Sabulibacter ruber TaxID=2811901 RepID=UPI001A96F9F1|nr:hypothetical protein [Sabulibacter ruber]